MTDEAACCCVLLLRCIQDGGPVLMDLLWSDPTTNDSVQGVQPSPRGPGLVTFGPDRVKDFCKVRGGLAGLRSGTCACMLGMISQLVCAWACLRAICAAPFVSLLTRLARALLALLLPRRPTTCR